MNILQLTGMKSTKYGGLESYFVELQKNYNRGKIIWIYNECPSNQAYINDILKYGGEIRCINANNRLHYMKEIINICKLEGGGGKFGRSFSLWLLLHCTNFEIAVSKVEIILICSL